MRMYRQGDILLEETDSLPKNLKKKDNVLARGEATGHKHQIVNGKVLISNSGEQFVVANNETQLVHEEHAPIVLTDAIFRVRRQREYDITEGVRQVMD